MVRAISPILSIVLAVSIFFFFTRPMFAEIKLTQDETLEYQLAVEEARDFNTKLTQRTNAMNSFSSSELDRLNVLVADSVDEVRALVDLEALAEEHKMLFGNIAVSESASKVATDEDGARSGSISQGDFETAEISFGVIGTYDQLKDFVKDIERSLVLMEITNISFSVIEGDLQQYSFTVRLYSFTQSFE